MGNELQQVIRDECTLTYSEATAVEIVLKSFCYLHRDQVPLAFPLIVKNLFILEAFVLQLPLFKFMLWHVSQENLHCTYGK